MVGEQLDGGEALSQTRGEEGGGSSVAPPGQQVAATMTAPKAPEQAALVGETGNFTTPSCVAEARLDNGLDAFSPSLNVAQLQHSSSSASSPSRSALGAHVGGSPTTNIRERLQFLGIDDQKIVCRRECQLARRDEEALLKQLLKTAEAYSAALEKVRSVGEQPDGGAGPVISPELAARYEERIRLIRGTVAAVSAEPPASLPKLTPVERAKGLALSSFSQTATVVKGVGDKTGLTEPVSGAVTGAVTGFRGAFARAASTIREQVAPRPADAGAWEDVQAESSGAVHGGAESGAARESI